MKAINELIVELFTSPYWENKHIHDNSNRSTNRNAIQACQCYENRVAVAVSRDYDKTVGIKCNPKTVLVGNQRRPYLHKGCHNSCLCMNDLLGTDHSVYTYKNIRSVLLFGYCIIPFSIFFLFSCLTKPMILNFFYCVEESIHNKHYFLEFYFLSIRTCTDIGSQNQTAPNPIYLLVSLYFCFFLFFY